MKRRSLSDVAEEVARSTQASSPQDAAERKVRVTFLWPHALVEQLRDAAYWTPGATMTGLAEEGVRDRIADLEGERGAPFPQRTGPVPTGRPPKS